MTKVEIYNSDYTKLNHAYIQFYETYKKMIEAEDPDPEVIEAFTVFFTVMNPTLDLIKSEMTVKTHYKEDSVSETNRKAKAASSVKKEIDANGAVIFYPEFN